MKKSTLLFILLATFFSLSSGIAHILLPYLFPLRTYLVPYANQEIIPLYLPWLFHTINFLFAYLSIWSAILTLIALLRWKINKEMLLWLLGGMTLYWYTAIVYEIFYPFPVKMVFFIFPAVAILSSIAHTISLHLYIRDKKVVF